MREPEGEGREALNPFVRMGITPILLVKAGLLITVGAIFARPELATASLDQLERIVTANGEQLALIAGSMAALYTAYQEIREKARHGTRKLTGDELSAVLHLSHSQSKDTDEKKKSGAPK